MRPPQAVFSSSSSVPASRARPLHTNLSESQSPPSAPQRVLQLRARCRPRLPPEEAGLGYEHVGRGHGRGDLSVRGISFAGVPGERSRGAVVLLVQAGLFLFWRVRRQPSLITGGIVVVHAKTTAPRMGRVWYLRL